MNLLFAHGDNFVERILEEDSFRRSLAWRIDTEDTYLAAPLPIHIVLGCQRE
jgi:hypothetical protein